MILKNILEKTKNDGLLIDLKELNIQDPENTSIAKNLFFTVELLLRKIKKPLNKKQQKEILQKIIDGIKELS